MRRGSKQFRRNHLSGTSPVAYIWLDLPQYVAASGLETMKKAMRPLMAAYMNHGEARRAKYSKQAPRHRPARRAWVISGKWLESKLRFCWPGAVIEPARKAFTTHFSGRQVAQGLVLPRWLLTLAQYMPPLLVVTSMPFLALYGHSISMRWLAYSICL